MPKIKFFGLDPKPTDTLCRQRGGAKGSVYELINSEKIEFFYQEEPVPIRFSTVDAMWEVKRRSKGGNRLPIEKDAAFVEKYKSLNGSTSLSVISNTLPTRLILKMKRDNTAVEVLTIYWAQQGAVNSVGFAGWIEYESGSSPVVYGANGALPVRIIFLFCI
jgi:hypothetical protein